MNDEVEHNGKKYQVIYTHERVFCGDKISPRGGTTSARIDLIYDEGDYAMGGLIAVASCSPDDVYSKKKGREIAKGRIQQMLAKL
jgi:hypothetical protein